ncbi:Branched-chain amino acid aminotransferase [Operophtera brumata]|uniref:Branched-chain amino acid aminotransferase n=1 Tax=Operophtera brumata TaxID=104452 RepID=A0A0L7LLV4_OPEBR|nr:Branched-chain amino acid aminotransferase [Operophtera brumata]
MCHSSVKGKSEEIIIAQSGEETNVRVDSIEKKCDGNEAVIFTLKDEIENLHRNAKISYLELRNVPAKLQESKEEPVKIVTQLGKTINLELSASDIKNI